MEMRKKSVYVTVKQKKKLIELIAKHPELISCKVTQDFNYKDSQQLWHNIAKECNAIPGAKKTWRQWKKTWQDIKSKTKKRQQLANGEIPISASIYTVEEQEALGLKNVSSTTSYQDSTEFVSMEEDNLQDSFDYEVGSPPSASGSECPPEEILSPAEEVVKQSKSSKKVKAKHSDSCIFNCDMLAVQEQRKLQIKEDYYKFKKDYLKNKLIFLKEQTEALKNIAKELAK